MKGKSVKNDLWKKNEKFCWLQWRQINESLPPKTEIWKWVFKDEENRERKEQCLNENGSEFRGTLEEVVYQILFFFYFSQIVKYGGSQIDIEVGGCW